MVGGHFAKARKRGRGCAGPFALQEALFSAIRWRPRYGSTPAASARVASGLWSRGGFSERRGHLRAAPAVQKFVTPPFFPPPHWSAGAAPGGSFPFPHGGCTYYDVRVCLIFW